MTRKWRPRSSISRPRRRCPVFHMTGAAPSEWSSENREILHARDGRVSSASNAACKCSGDQQHYLEPSARGAVSTPRRPGRAGHFNGLVWDPGQGWTFRARGQLGNDLRRVGAVRRSETGPSACRWCAGAACGRADPSHSSSRAASRNSVRRRPAPSAGQVSWPRGLRRRSRRPADNEIDLAPAALVLGAWMLAYYAAEAAV